MCVSRYMCVTVCCMCDRERILIWDIYVYYHERMLFLNNMKIYFKFWGGKGDI